MNRTNLVAGTVILVAALLGSTPFIIEHTSIDSQQRSFNSSVEVVDPGENSSLGINADRTLNFGRIYTGSNATKKLNVSVPRKSVVNLRSEGNISDILYHEERLYFEGRKEIELEARGEQAGYYTGKFIIDVQVPQDRFGKYLLDARDSYRGFW